MILDKVLVAMWNAVSCLIFLYYTNSALEYRYSRARSNVLIIIGYIIYDSLCRFDMNTLNAIGFVVTSFLLLFFGFKESWVSAVFKAIILTAFMMFGELIVFTFVFNITVDARPDVFLEPVLMILSKMIYFLLVILFKRISKRQSYQHFRELILIFVLPVSTCIFLHIFNNVFYIIDADTKIMFYICCIMLIVSNFIVYIIYDKNIDKTVKIQQLQSLEHKKDLDYRSYQLLKEQYLDLRVRVHDFDEYCNNIAAQLAEDRPDVMSQVQKLKNKNKEFLLAEYTNNKVLNILLSQKMKECNKEGIDFQVSAGKVDLSFIDEMDIVSIFANLIDNAIESCRISENKNIYLSICTMNDAFIVINTDNSADTAPVTKNGCLQTTKKDKSIHGVGIISIEQSLKNYDGKMKWNYDMDSRVFSTTILIPFYTKTSRN